MKRAVAALLLSCGAFLAGCDDGVQRQLENEMILMQERLAELETQVGDSQAQAVRVTAGLTELQAQIRDLEAEIIDLSAYVPRDLLVNAEAIVGQARTKIEEVRMHAIALEAELRPEYVD